MKLRALSRIASTCVSVTAFIAAALVPLAITAAPAQAAVPQTPSASASVAPAGERSVIISVPKGKLDALVAFVSTLRLTTAYQYRYALNGVALTASAGQVALIQSTFPDAKVQDDVTYRVADVQSNAPWNLSSLNQTGFPAPSSYTYPTSAGRGVKAYVIDTGISPNSSQFGTRLAQGFDFTNSGSTTDCDGHGTHVAGTIGSLTYGVAKNVTLVPLRAIGGLDRRGRCTNSGSTSDVIAAINWAIADNPDGKLAVINMSLGATTPGGQDQDMNTAVAAARADGIVVVVAAGNSATTVQADGSVDGNACHYSPANSPGTITVGAIDSAGREASFSNFGPCVDIFAPGVGIRSLTPGSVNGYAVMSGTSMASPHVAGAVALYMSEHPSADVTQVTSAMLQSVLPGIVQINSGGDSVYDTSGNAVTNSTSPAHSCTSAGMLSVQGSLAARGIPNVEVSQRWGADCNPAISGAASTVLTVTASSTENTQQIRWYRCSSALRTTSVQPTNSVCQLIPLQTLPTYTVTPDDAGFYISSSVTSTDGSTLQTVWAASALKINEVPVNTAPPSVVATATSVGTLISVNDGTWRGTPANRYSHQWYSCTAAVVSASTSRPTVCTSIEGATGTTLEIGTDLSGRFLLVETRAQNAASGTTPISVFSPTTPAVQSAPIFQSLSARLTVTNLGANQAPQVMPSSATSSRLTATPGNWFGFPVPTYTYLWYRCDSRIGVARADVPTGCVSTGVTGATYTVTQADIGSFMAPEVTATNPLGSATQFLPATAIVGQAPVVTARPAVTATSPRVGRAISLSAGTWMGSPTPSLSFQWYVCTGAVRSTISKLPVGCTRVTGPQRSTITPRAAMVGRYLLVSVTARNAVASSAGITTYSKSTAVVRY